MEEVLPCFDLGFDCLLPTEPEEKKQKKEAPERFASLDDRELDDPSRELKQSRQNMQQNTP